MKSRIRICKNKLKILTFDPTVAPRAPGGSKFYFVQTCPCRVSFWSLWIAKFEYATTNSKFWYLTPQWPLDPPTGGPNFTFSKLGRVGYHFKASDKLRWNMPNSVKYFDIWPHSDPLTPWGQIFIFSKIGHVGCNFEANEDMSPNMQCRSR